MNFINQIVVGGLGATAIAAVGFSGSITFIVFITLGSIGSSVGILAARAHGAGRVHELNAMVHVALIIGLAISMACVAVPLFFPVELLTYAGGSPTVVATGAPYLQIVSLSLLSSIAGRVFAGMMRAVGRTREPLIATSITTVLNTALGFCLVYGYGPFPEMGVVGAAWATLVTSALNLAVLVFQSYSLHKLVHWELPASWREWVETARPLAVLAAPLALTELVWSVGGYLYNVLFQRLGDEALAAAQINGSLESIFIIGSFGLMTAASTLVGHSIGQGDGAAAKLWVHRVRRIAVGTSIAFGIAFLASGFTLPWLFPNVSEDVRHFALVAIAINAAFHWAKVQNMVMGGGLLPAGSDMRGVVIGDAVGAFVIGLPLSIWLCFFTPLGFYGIVIARTLEELVKACIYQRRLAHLDWQKLADEHGIEAASD